MLIIKIRSELVHSPIRIFNENGYEIFNDLDYIYNDKKLLSLTKKAEKLYDSYYDFNRQDDSIFFDEKLEKKNKNKMLHLINKIKKRLNQINNNNFIIEDYETERLINL